MLYDHTESGSVLQFGGTMKNKKRSLKRRRIGVIAVILLLIATVTGCLRMKFHWNVSFETEQFAESARALDNPNRGFYNIYGFYIDDHQSDYEQQVRKLFQKDQKTELALLEINLVEYRTGVISEQGLQNIDALFEACKPMGKRLIVRFLYDCDGNNMEKEPEELSIILGHMQQVGEILQKHSEQIFTLQGLFIGNWGEMHGTRYADKNSLYRLAEQLAAVTDEKTYLSVRTPVQWRKIMEIAKKSGNTQLEGRLGLFNDGMMGNESDYGTYLGESMENPEASWGRKEELAFQETLCETVPNGGEVIVDNAYNDFEHALESLNKMHVTYLNEAYDREVLDKWADAVVQSEDAYDGMDGYTYISRHMGYRLYLSRVAMEHDFWEDTAEIKIGIQNAGFAPMYEKCHAILTLCGVDTEEKHTFSLPNHIPDLTGGNQSNERQTLRKKIPLKELTGKTYRVYFRLEGAQSGEDILLANQQKKEKDGYYLGTIQLE